MRAAIKRSRETGQLDAKDADPMAGKESLSVFESCNIVIAAAAVSDYKPSNKFAEKQAIILWFQSHKQKL